MKYFFGLLELGTKDIFSILNTETSQMVKGSWFRHGRFSAVEVHVNGLNKNPKICFFLRFFPSFFSILSIDYPNFLAKVPSF